MSTKRITREIETRTVRRLEIEDVEAALRDQYDLHVQDDIRFEWDVSQDFVRAVEIIHVERTSEELDAE